MTAPEIRPATELKPCPLCGEESAVGYSTGFKRVRCNSCFCGTEPSIEGPEKAISRWNTRPIEDSLRAEAQERDRQIAAQAEEIEWLKTYKRVMESRMKMMTWPPKPESPVR